MNPRPYNQKEPGSEQSGTESKQSLYVTNVGENQYKIDLIKLGPKTEGVFPCPKCGVTIDPNDASEEVYAVIDIGYKGDALEEVMIQCNKCNSEMTLVGFLSETKK